MTRLVGNGLSLPFSPMRRVHDNGLLGCCVQPSTENPAAGKDKRMDAAVIDDGQFQIAVERRGGYGLPSHSQMIRCRCLGALI